MVSVIIPAYNCERSLEEAVCSALAQSCEEIEILILDDMSKDGTLAAAAELAALDSRVRVFKNEENLGAAGTRNRGIDEALGEFLAFLDGDDVWHPDKLETQLKYLEREKLDICYTAYSFIDADGKEIRSVYHVPERVIWQKLLRENVIGLSTALVRRSALGNIRMRGEYAHEDYVFWLELLQNGCRAGGIDKPLARYRISESNRSGDKKKAAKNRWIVYRHFLKMGRIRSGFVFASYCVRGVWKHFLR